MTELHAYDPHWADEFARTAAQLRSVGDPSWAFEHIGSTSVPGLPGAASAVAGPDYTRTKALVVLEIVNRARAARGLGPLADLDSGA